MIVDILEMRGEGTERDTGGAAYMGEVMAKSDLGDIAIAHPVPSPSKSLRAMVSPQWTRRSSSIHPCKEILLPAPLANEVAAWAGQVRSTGHGSNQVFNIFAEDDGVREGDSSPASKRVRSSSHPLEAAENGLAPTAAVMVKGVQLPGSVHDERPPWGEQEYKAHQVVSEAKSEYIVTTFTKIWLSQAAVDPKIVKKYRAE